MDFWPLIESILKAHHIDNGDYSVDSFFANGISFPQLVALSFNIDSIPGINKNPKNIFVRKSNNNLALQYLIQNNSFFRNSRHTFSYELMNEKFDLLNSFFQKQYIKMTPAEALEKCNLKLVTMGVQYHNIDDMKNPTFIFLLLHILTDNEIPIFTETNSDGDINEIMKKSFEKANVPYIEHFTADEMSFIIQLQLILQAFDKKEVQQLSKPQETTPIEKIEIKPEQHQNEKKSNDQIETEKKSTQINKPSNPPKKTEKEEKSTKDQIETEKKSTRIQFKKPENEKIEFSFKLENFNENDITDDDESFFDEEEELNEDEILDEKMEEEDDDDNEKSNKLKIGEDEKLEDEALLKTINFLSKKQFSKEYPEFTKFKQTLFNDFIPKFVIKFFNITSIKNVEITDTKNNTKTLTKQGIKNVYSVIKFLATKEKTFDVLMFDFYSPFDREFSCKLLFKNFLNFFFITKSRDEMIERLNTFISCNKNNPRRSLTMNMPRYQLLIQTMRFISQKPDEMVEGLLIMHQKFFELFSIPIVFDNNQWNTYSNDDVLPDSYFYQIQLIFNEWDSNKTTFPIIELLLKSKSKIEKIKVPRLDILESGIKAKSIINETEHQDESNENKDENDEENENEIFKNQKIENLNELMKYKILRKYKERQKRIGNDDSNENELMNKLYQTLRIELSDNAFKYWDPPVTSYIFENGITKPKINEKPYVINFKSIGQNRSDRKEFYSNTNQNDQNNNIDNNEFAVKMLNTHSNKETELFKIFYYDEKIKEWKFDSNAFQSFSKIKRLNISGTKTPLIFIANSDEKDIIDFNSHFIHGLYPKLEKEEDQIFVYPICDKSLTMLSMKNDFNDPNKASTKPIFLQIHVPKRKENDPNLLTILTQINCYLICISCLTILILKDHISQDQISYYQTILNISKKANYNDNNNSLNEEEEERNESGFIHKRSNTIYLINFNEIPYNESSAVEYHNHSEFKNLIDQSDNHEILLIDIKKVETYNHFFDSLSHIILNNNMKFSEVERDFNSSLFDFQMGTKYILTRNMKVWRFELKNSIKNRYLFFVSKENKKMSEALSIVYNEITSFSPRFDIEYVKEYQEIAFEMRKDTTKASRNEIDKELNLSSDYDIKYISNLIKNEDFLTDEQMNNLRKNHELFVKNEFYDIVKLKNDKSMFDIVFEDNSDLVSKQIFSDRDVLKKIFREFIDLLKKRTTVVENNPQEEAKKNTNYTLKETENLREIKVAVKINKDLTSIIEQDF